MGEGLMSEESIGPKTARALVDLMNNHAQAMEEHREFLKLFDASMTGELAGLKESIDELMEADSLRPDPGTAADDLAKTVLMLVEKADDRD